MINTCFQLYFQPVYIYIKRSFEMAIDNKGIILIMSTIFTGATELIGKALHINFFGVPNFLLFLVIMTVLIDARYGIMKSVMQSKEALLKSSNYAENTPEYRKEIKIYNLKKFQVVKLQFTFFKCFTLLGYLFFIKHLINIDTTGYLGEILGFTSDILLKVPVAIFWYYDFKSIGDNSTYIYGKKAPIFTIVENILEFRINKFFKKEQP